MKKTFWIFSIALLILSFAGIMLFSAVAADASVTEGYVMAEGGQLTNIKWKITSPGDGGTTLSFAIDPAASDKLQTTVLYGVNTQKGTLVSHGQGNTVAWGAYQSSITDIKIGEGITEINGGIANSFSSLRTIELPGSLTAIKNKTFVGCASLVSIYVSGNEPVEGEADLSNVTTLGSYIFDNCKKLSVFNLSENFSGGLEKEAFKWTSMKEFIIPAGTASIGSKTFGYCKSLESVWCYAENYTIEENLFDNCDKLTYIYGIPGTPLEEYCRKNDVSFRNINNPNEYIYKSTKEPDIFDPTGATAYGNIINMWNGNVVVDVYWLYYEDTKTLKFVSNKTGHNETGNCSYDEENHAWEAYKNDIEQVIIGKGISKISQKAFQGMTALKSVQSNGTITQMDANTFDGCTSLTTIYVSGNEPVEGTADLKGVTKIGDNAFRNTDIRNFIFSVNTPTLGDNIFPGLTASITCTPDDELIAYAVENYVDIIDISTGETVSKNYVYVDTSLPFCGNKAVFSFDEATGTLTVSGVGAISDIVNYYGGGSKTQFWFDIKQNIRKVVIEDGITAIGKYSFTQCMNLEYVELPDKNIAIGNAAFEGCENLKSIYRRGDEPIIGHLDLSGVAQLNSWTFSKCYLIANATLSSEVTDIGTTLFDSNPNISGIYGIPGSYAEQYASKNALTFYDISSEKPEDTVCEKPADTTDVQDITTAPDATDAPDTAAVPDSESEETREIILIIETDPVPGADSSGNSNIIPVIIIAAVAAVAVAAIVIVIINVKKK